MKIKSIDVTSVFFMRTFWNCGGSDLVFAGCYQFPPRFLFQEEFGSWQRIHWSAKLTMLLTRII